MTAETWTPEMFSQFSRLLSRALTNNCSLTRHEVNILIGACEAAKVQAEALARVTAQKDDIEAQWGVMARACGNWREWPVGTVVNSANDWTEREWQAGARAILERNELREALARVRQFCEGEIDTFNDTPPAEKTDFGAGEVNGYATVLALLPSGSPEAVSLDLHRTLNDGDSGFTCLECRVWRPDSAAEDHRYHRDTCSRFRREAPKGSPEAGGKDPVTGKFGPLGNMQGDDHPWRR